MLARRPFARFFVPALALPAVLAASACASRPQDDAQESAVTGEERLLHVRVATQEPEAGERLLAEGFDVVEGSGEDDGLEVIGSRSEIARLRGLGYTVTVLAVGGPLKEGREEALPYPSLDEMMATLRGLEASYPDIAKVVDLTERYGVPPTAQGRHLFALKISGNVAEEEDEPTHLIVANHHARELGTPVAAMYAAETLTSQYAKDARVRQIVDGTEIWIAPTWNPDGLAHVHTAERLWRKNRSLNGGSFGVDLNRNYPALWSSTCSGSTRPNSDTYKGPSAGSEAETVTMLAFATDRRFTKVLDLHSHGREVLTGYSCSNYALAAYHKAAAVELSNAIGYGGRTRKPSAQGEHPDWHHVNASNFTFLVEINRSFQPAFAEAQTEAVQVYRGILWQLERPIPVQGHVTDAETKAPLAAKIVVKEVLFTNGESNTSGGPFGRYQAFLPAGLYQLEFSAEGYATARRAVTVTDGGEVVLDVALTPAR